MATGGLYGSSGTGALIAQPGSESSGLYGNSTSFGGTYFEWFIFQTSETQPATPTGGTWNFTTNVNTPPTGWSSTPPSNPLNTVWVSIAIVNSKNTAPLVWSVPGKFAFSSGLPILFGNGAPNPGDGQSDQLYIQLDTTPQTIWAKEAGTWTRLTGSTLYADLTSNQTIAGTKTFSSQIQGSISGTASNVTGTVAITNGGTGSTTAGSARAALGAASSGANSDITSLSGLTTALSLSQGGTAATTAPDARTNLGLGSAAVLNAGVANGVATLDAGGTVPLSQIPASIQGGVSYQGTWNATTNTPTLTSSVGTKGYYYVVSVAGSTNLNGITSWNIGDWAIYNGTAWEKIDNTDAVTSVNGYTGTVVLNYADVGAPSTTGVNATGTWGINVTGNAATATTAGSATTATTATNVSGGTASVTTLTTSSTVTLNGGTANGVAYLNGSKVLTTGSALTFDGSTVTNTGVGYSVNNANALLRFGNAAATRTGYLQVRSDAFEVWSDQAAVPMVFGVSNTEQMRLTSTGLGIGTSSPGTKLDVVGAGTFKVDGSGSTTPLILRNNNTASTQVVKLAFDSNGAIKASINAAVYNNDYMTFNVGSDTERMRLDSSGNLGLGVTPSAWSTNNSQKALQISTVGALSALDAGAGNRQTNLSNNAYDFSSTTRYLTSDKASFYSQYAGIHAWYTAPSGTAGNAISFTQAMTLDASGFLGVGETSPTSRIHANGTIQARTGATGVQIYGDGGSGYVNSVGSNPLIFQVNSTERARIDSSGNFGIGVTNPGVPLDVKSNSSANAVTIRARGGNDYSFIVFRQSDGTEDLGGIANLRTAANTGNLLFYTAGGSSAAERARIDSSGNLLVGKTSTDEAVQGIAARGPNGLLVVTRDGGDPLSLRRTTNDGAIASFRRDATLVGTISVTTSATAYNTSSDYRLKENIAPMTGALAKVAALKPVTYTWKVDGSAGEGFIAHELAEVCPAAVTGEKDAVDAEGKPQYQGIDVSFLVGTLTAAIQEQQAIIQTLTARVAALESN